MAAQTQQFQLLRPMTLGLSLLFALGLLAGCEGYFDTEGEVVDGWCPIQSIDLLRPARDSTDAYVDGWIVTTLACAPRSMNITVTDPQGAVVPSDQEIFLEGRQIRLRPQGLLEPQTTYDGRLETSRGYNEWTFTTSELGTPVSDPLPGRTLSVKPRTALVLEPAGLDEILDDLFRGFSPVLEFTHPPSGGTVPVRLGGRLAGSVQDTAQQVRDLPASWQDPYWRFGPIELVWYLDGGELLIEDVVVSGALAPQPNDAGGGVSIEGVWDPRPAAGILGLEAEDLCAINLEEGGGGCISCEDGSPSCLPLRAVHISADTWAGHLNPNP